ncbi:hypothetical protein LPJ61_004727 [Coemansia biformis]|uniref:RRM domain-containing protein n=1 Tax=Coemansia biformis TaxID=1286918 RepID=A0A9W8CV24_9FUNG|nr:hypothetical protein LPJ61_004727 [Coemansia biformis]
MVVYDDAADSPSYDSYALVEFETSNDATSARSKLHHSRLFGQQLEVHFETKVPPPFRKMLEGARRTNSDDHRQPSDYSPEASPAPADHRYPPDRHGARYPPRGPSSYERRDRADDMRSSRAPPPPPPGAPPAYESRRGYDDRAGARYQTPQRPPYRPYSARRDYGEQGSYGASYSHGHRARAPYGDRDARGHDGYGSYHERRAPGRSVSPARRDSREAHEPAESGSWGDDRPERSNNGRAPSPRRAHSRGQSQVRNESGNWGRSPSPAAQPARSPAEAAAFNEDSLFSAP